MKFNYKKNKLDQLRGFCAVVECKNISNASKLLHISDSSVSLQISSLETDLGFLLFDRIKNKLVLNEKGKSYYKEAKRVLLDLDKIYSGKIEMRKISRIEMFLLTIKKKHLICKRNVVNFLKKMIIKITWKNFLLSLAFILLSIWLYLYKTNWFFDRKLYKLANPLLREVMEKEYYRINKTDICSFQVMQMILDVDSLMLGLANQDNVFMTKVLVYNSPSTALRMEGNTETDGKFNDQNYITCDTKKRYEAYLLLHRNMEELCQNAAQFKYYSLYRNTNSLNHEIFEQNLKKYHNNLVGIHLDNKVDAVEDGSFWIIKHKSYYYLLLETNGKEPGHNLHHPEERYLIFKKLTLDQLKTYDNGSYWKLIKDYNIRID